MTDASGPAATGDDGTVASTDSSADAPDAESVSDAQSTDEVTYSGVVLATANQGGGGTTYSVFADFAPGAGFGPGQCEADAGACACSHGIADPDVFDTPGAGEVIVTDDAGLIAALSPASIVMDGDTVMTSYQGTWELGQPWSDYAGVYPLADAGAWRPGDALQVSAMGGQVDRFSGTLQTGALLTGVTPAIGPDASVVIDRSQDFTLAWTAEGRAGECVLLMLQQIASNGAVTCYCWVPDALSGLTVGTSILGGFGTEQLGASVRIERLRVSTAACGNATMALVSEVAQAADVTFE